MRDFIILLCSIAAHIFSSKGVALGLALLLFWIKGKQLGFNSEKWENYFLELSQRKVIRTALSISGISIVVATFLSYIILDKTGFDYAFITAAIMLCCSILWFGKKWKDFVAKERFANGRVCPLCGCIHVVRNGHRKDGTQRYVCKDCGKSFVIATNSIVSGTRKDLSVWEQYIDCMMNGLSIRKTAVACGIHRNTAFLWRHKILDALQNMADDVTLDGIIEADETFFAISYKGNHSKSKTFAMPRKAHKRGHSTHIRGLSQEKVCVPCAVNRNGLSISKITNTGRVSTRDLHHIYDGRIKTNSTLVTDKMNSYVRFTNANSIDLVQLKTGKAKKGIYNIQHINSYHSQLKRFMRGFNGVSTKYLNNYLVWNNLVNYAKESDMEKRNIFLTFVLATLKTAKCRDLSNRPAVPLVA